MVRHPHHAPDGRARTGRSRRLLSRRLLALVALLAVYASAAAGASPLPDRPFLAYLASWYEPATNGDGSKAAMTRLAGQVDLLALAFARPDALYPPGGELAGTGLQFQFPTATLRQAVRRMKERNPRLRVLVSVGGSAYRRWDRYDEHALARLVRDIGADGIDLDYEPAEPGCASAGGRVACRTDGEWTALVRRTRAVLPRPLLLTVPGWSVGAYGEGPWADARPRSPWTGSMLGLLRSPEAAMIDLVSIMSYDAGPDYDPGEALAAYRRVWRGPLAVGIQVLPSEIPGPRFTVAHTRALLRRAVADPRVGAMLYGFNLAPPGAISPDNPDAAVLAEEICHALGRTGCGRQR